MAKLVHLKFKVIQKDVLQKIKFCRPYTQISRRFRRKVFFAGVDTTGLVLMRRKDTKIIVFARKAPISMYNTAAKPYRYWEKLLGIQVEFAFIPLSADKIDDGYMELLYILHRTPNNDLFDRVCSLVEDQNKVPRRMLKFEDFNTRSVKSDKGLLAQYRFKAGIYFILEIRPNEPEEIVYIGQSVSGVGKRVRSHFCKPKIDENRCYRVSYFKTKDTYKYMLCVLEVPVLRYETQDQITEEVLGLEKALIKQFNPRDNRMYKENTENWESIPYTEPENTNYF